MTYDTSSLPERDLPPGRHSQLKEHMMREIRQARAEDEPANRRRRWSRPVVAGPAVAAALVLAVITAVTVTGADSGGSGTPVGKDGKATYAFAPMVNGDTKGGAAALLDRIATVAARSPAGDIRDDQFVYIRSLVAYATTSDDIGAELELLHEREVWMSVDGTRAGLIREPGDEFSDGRELEPAPAPGEPGYESSTHYRHLQTLPTDADAMLKWLRSQGSKEDEDRDLDQDAYVLIGDLLHESMMPPNVSAALFRAAAKIPGVVVVPDAVDADGRHGVAVARYDAYNPGVRDELIFDRETLELIGVRSVATKATDTIEAGQVLGTTAILQRAVVDTKGKRP
ncbi:CU044_5270 family protein [Streptomyces sp. NBC_01460]|uniref:CU044_5270 family protein n=1 Tax=Streptomyces sp. NBC_01460 TaxID=2903875 RepID=UPI002E319D9F|nr:CU044_5270 family protein [Streptomyces sp. NBC_01460]